MRLSFYKLGHFQCLDHSTAKHYQNESEDEDDEKDEKQTNIPKVFLMLIRAS